MSTEQGPVYTRKRKEDLSESNGKKCRQAAQRWVAAVRGHGNMSKLILIVPVG